MLVLCILFNLALLCQGHKSTNDGLGFGYPEAEEENPSKKNAQNKNPVNVPNRCKTGEILYPGDQSDDWVCDCKPAYLYYPEKQQCYPAYTKGPCRHGEYLVLRGNNVIPECVINPCTIENYVPFKSGCHKLDEGGPCTFPELSNVVGVNETTLEIICTQDYRIQMQINTRFNNDDQSNKNETTAIGTITTTTPSPPIQPISNGTNYYKRECLIGGIRWTKVECPQQDTDSVIQTIFSIPRY